MYLHHLAYYGIAILTLFYFFFVIIPFRISKLTFYKTKNMKFSKYTAMEIGLKSSYIAYLIQGITEYNLNKKPMIFVCVIFLVVLNFMYKKIINKNI